jgi:hypothetical protein
VWHRRVPAPARLGDLEVVLARYDRADAHGDVVRFQGRHVVHGVDRIHEEAVEQSVCDHLQGAAFVLLRRLEDEHHGAVEIGSEQLRSPGGMAV